MFSISKKPINSAKLSKSLINDTTGALATFEGIVRNHNDGQNVQQLDYEAMEPLCLKEAQIIFEEARKKFDIAKACGVHRIGHLKIGDTAVWVGVSASHRDDAFRACRYIIDEIKSRLPIWKKEHYTDGDSGWVNCEAPRKRNKR